MKFYKRQLATEGKVIQKHFFALLPVTISGETKWLEMVGVEYVKKRVYDGDCPLPLSWLEWVPSRFVSADPFIFVYYRRYINEIQYGQGGVFGFLLRRISLLIWGRCDACQAIRGLNGRCPYEALEAAERGE